PLGDDCDRALRGAVFGPAHGGARRRVGVTGAGRAVSFRSVGAAVGTAAVRAAGDDGPQRRDERDLHSAGFSPEGTAEAKRSAKCSAERAADRSSSKSGGAGGVASLASSSSTSRLAMPCPSSAARSRRVLLPCRAI